MSSVPPNRPFYIPKLRLSHSRMDRPPDPRLTPSLRIFPQPPRAPVEVCERIIQAVTAGTHGSPENLYPLMSACALVCRSWVPMSRSQLFAKVLLRDAVRTERLLRTVAGSSLGSLVKELQLDFPEDYQSQAKNKIKTAYSLAWVYKALCLAGYLTNLETLQLWRMPALYPTSMVHFSRFNPVKSLDLSQSTISFLEVVQLVNRLSCLQKLKMSISTCRQPAHCYAGKKHQLTSLHVFFDKDDFLNGVDVLKWLIKSGSALLLTDLTWGCVHATHISLLNTMLESCQATLKTTTFRLNQKFQKGRLA